MIACHYVAQEVAQEGVIEYSRVWNTGSDSIWSLYREGISDYSET